MARKSNLELAHNKVILEVIKAGEELTTTLMDEIVNAAAREFNLDEAKTIDLRSMDYASKAEPKLNSIDEIELLKEQIEFLAKTVENLTNALSRIGSLTGYGNHLGEYGIDKWEPGKQHLQKFN